MEFGTPTFALGAQTAIVTGGAMGIGAGIAEALCGMGANVIIADRDLNAAQAQVTRITNAGFAAAAMEVDLVEESSVIHAVAAIIEQHGSPDILVNNAGVQDRQRLLDADAVEWDRTMDINARGTFLMVREVAKAMVAGGRGGRIVNIASAGVRHPMIHGLISYAASKNAVMGITQNAAFELARYGITVNAVLPGGVSTPGGRTARGPAPEGPALRGAPLGQCEPRDIGAAVAFLASPAARFITNQAITVDAGFMLT
jgi:NAD(P)-dependent dehydrogenase (short-subunit alcohol dehydrogenase family)